MSKFTLQSSFGMRLNKIVLHDNNRELLCEAYTVTSKYTPEEKHFDEIEQARAYFNNEVKKYMKNGEGNAQ